ncbi:MAG TPA: type I-E CRISPR-associated protein Cas5/CasD, partial [Rubrivivax sp.]|nr:type I-E CRISPR-associated protein Cas5/CasD [Rubrivivax sp.]
MQFLVFQLVAPMAAWGDVAVGQYRGSRDAPGESALLGLLAAALGIRRDDEAAHAALRDGYAFAVGTVDPGSLLRDYHTAQVPSRGDLKGRPHRTRRDELAMPKHALNTILSARDYRQGGAW